MTKRRLGRGLGVLVALTIAAVALPSALANSIPQTRDELPLELQEVLELPVRAWIGEKAKSKNDDGVKNKRGTYSRSFQKVDDSTYQVTVHIDTAETNRQITERFLLDLKKNGTDEWEVANEDLKDTYIGMFRETSGRCYPFEGFSFDREGMTISGSNGSVCEVYYEGDVSSFAVHSKDMKYSYAPPAHVRLVHTGHDFYALHKLLGKDHSRELDFDPAAVLMMCDSTTCDELLKESFTGLDQNPERDGAGLQFGAEWAAKLSAQYARERKENAFAHFRPPNYVPFVGAPSDKYYAAFVLREINELKYPGSTQALPGSGVALLYNKRGGFEVEFLVFPRRTDDFEQMIGPVYGYYSEETLKHNEPYELERREDEFSRWHDVYSVNGLVELALVDDEMLHGDIEFGINLKMDIRELPFYIGGIRERSATGKDKPAPLFVNSIQMDGEELTWVRTGASSGMVVLPEKMPAGSRIKLRVNFETRAIKKRNHAFSAMNRFGWMPFVRFGDFIDEFELTIKSPAKYTILGVGQKVSETKEGNVLISHWKAESPVVFPTIIFGKYFSRGPKFDALKADGTVIPVQVHVDEVSMHQLNLDVTSFEQAEEFIEAVSAGAFGIRPNQLRPIAEQAANSINLFRELSGLDYPYGSLNLVNDPVFFLYGQAPSSLIYLSSLAFRGEGTMAGDTVLGGGGTRTSKFLKSVTAHEVGHQWWGSRISNANQRNYWFVESLAEYFSAIYLENVFGWKDYQEQVDEWRNDILNAERKVSVQNASALWTGERGGYYTSVYSKGPYAFHMLREIFGDEKFFEFMKKFSRELAEKREIVTLDIQQAAERGFGGVDAEGNPYTVDLSWFFDQWIRGVGLPQYSFTYDVRKTEDGGYLIEGSIKQRVVVGSKRNPEVLEGKFYRGVVNITVDAKGEEYRQRIVLEGEETPFRLKVAKKPLEVALNKYGDTLAHDVLVNQSW